MRILHVGVGNFGQGGVATYVCGVFKAQRARGHEVHVAELWPGPRSMDEVQTTLAHLGELSELQDRFRPDVTHLHSQLPEYATTRRATVLTAHDHMSHCPSGGRFLEARRRECGREFSGLGCLWGHYVDRCGSRNPRSMLERFRTTAATPTFPGHWIAPSSYTGDWLARRGVEDRRIHVLGNPQTNESLEPSSSSEPVVAFVGRLVANKGCEVLLAALRDLPEPARVWIIGDGPARAELENLAQRTGIAQRVEFLGWLAPAEVHARLARTRVLAVPSLWPEPFGLVALEAYSVGCPVVASAVGGLRDLVQEGRTGRLVPADDPRALARALEQFLDDPQLARSSGLAGRDWAMHRFPFEGHLDALEGVYRNSIEEPR